MVEMEAKQNRRQFLLSASQIAALAACGPATGPMGWASSFASEGDPTRDATTARNIYRTHQLPEHELQTMYEQLLESACANGDAAWKTAVFDSSAGFWGNGVSVGNDGIRTVASVLLGCATLMRYAEQLDSSLRKDFLEKSKAAVRFITATHRTGSARCPDGKQWGATPTFGGGSWQSGMWTGTFAWASWLIWDQLGDELQKSLERVIAWECDILSHRPPPNNLWLDTKAEENGWEIPPLVMGALMFPMQPHAVDWQQAAIRYMMNTLCTEADTHNATLVDERPVNEWVKGANVQPDYTLENHNIFHPSYVACSSYFLTQAVMYYTFTRRPVPQAATHHLLDTWRMYQTVILPWGEAAYPQGMDWEFHGLPYINLFASLATGWHDPLASHFEQSILQYMRAWQAIGGGSLAIPGSPQGFGRSAINIEQASYGFLAHKIFGAGAKPLSSSAAAAQEQGVHQYPYVDFITHRTPKKFASFSWKNRIMGTLVPLAAGHEGNPFVTVPIQNGFVGSFVLNPVGDAKADRKVEVVEQARHDTGNGFETTGAVMLNSGRLKQKIRMTSIGSQTVVYEDEVTAVADVTIEKELGIPIGIENDEITSGTRVVTKQDGQESVNWKDRKPPVSIAGRWVNVDSRMSVVAVAGAGVVYAPGSGYLPGVAVNCDTLYGSYSDRPRQFKAGEVVARRVAVFFVEVTPQQTSRLSEWCKLEEQGSSQVLTIRQPDGQACKVPIAFGRLNSLRD